MDNNDIPSWYANRSVFVTGGAGFMGKVLLEKLIRSCPKIHRVYILIRSKRGLTSNQRRDGIVKSPVFDTIRKTNPELLLKLVAIDGDIEKDGLGIKYSDAELLKNEVSVVFHGAASLRLEAGLRAAVNNNCIATKQVIDFCAQFLNLKVFLHMSTAFCHCEEDILTEKVYEPPLSPKHVLSLLEIFDDELIDLITPKLLRSHPNCYTYSKRLAEAIVNEYGDKIPIVIARPSIVIPALREPMPGWVDSLNGPVGVLVASGKGVIRSMLVEGSNNAEVIPVDIAINGIIVAAWHRATNSFDSTPVYNMTSGELLKYTWGDVLVEGKKALKDIPFGWPIIWYPDGGIRTNRIMHSIIVFFFHILPAYFIDFLMLIFMQKRFMIRIQKRISVGLEVLQYFTLRNWKFDNNKFLSLTEKMTNSDIETFYMSNVNFEISSYIRTAIYGARTYCMKEDPSTIPKAKILHKFLYVLDRSIKFFILYQVIYFILWCLESTHLLTFDYWK